MGMFSTITIDNSIELPHFPEEIDRSAMNWQSKRGALDRYAGPYRITADGRVEQKKVSHRDKTDEEKQAEAERWGFDSWEEYVQAYEEHDWDEGGLWPEELDYDSDEDGYGDEPPTMTPSEKTTDEIWWADENLHGTFEFHQAIKRDPIEYETITHPKKDDFERPSDHALEVLLEYEARFNKGELDTIVFMGERMSSHDDPIGQAIDKIEEWREWKEENDGER